MAAKLARFSWLPGGLAAVLVIAVGRLLSSTSSAPLELAVYDRVVRSASVHPLDDIVIVAIDDASIERLGAWPWPRDVHASLLERLRTYGARVVAFSTPFDAAPRTSEVERLRAALALLEASNLGNSDQARQLRALLGESAPGRDPDAHLANAIAAHGNVVLPIDVRLTDAGQGSGSLPAELLIEANALALRHAQRASISNAPADVFVQRAAGIGHTLLHTDADGTLRSDLTALDTGNALLPSLAVAIAARATGTDAAAMTWNTTGRLYLGERSVRVDDELRVRPHVFAAQGPAAFARFSYSQVLAGEVPLQALRGKIVLIGFVDSVANATAVATPADRATPGIFATANTVSSLIKGPRYDRPSTAVVVEWGAALIVVLWAAFAVPAAGLLLGAVTTALLVAALVVTEVGLLGSMHLWTRLMLPAVAVLAGFGLYLVGELVRRANSKGESSANTGSNLRQLGQTFQRQGQLDLAFETYQRCPLDAATMELLYFLGMDFERRRQLQKAGAVYAYIATRDPNYRDLRARRARVKEESGQVRESPPRPMTRPVATVTAPAVEDDYDEAPRAPYRTLGRYEIERELGKGAMGIVYLGRDPKINRIVAIKAIPLAEEFEEQDLAEARARFFREAEMAGRLNHPAIVTVYDAGEDQGLAYIAMEYLRGQHLSHFTDPSRLLPPRTVMLLVARVAEALHYAHRQNVVHRDIKPANIMFNPETDELKITDFGIARLTDTSRTKTGIVLGTPSFMSPEQLEGRTLDGRSDQFALGVSLYQLLCGQLPFRAESMPKLMHKIATEPHAPVRLLRPELPEAIEPIIDRVLRKSADERYATCGELAVALRQCVEADTDATAAEGRHEWLIP